MWTFSTLQIADGSIPDRAFRTPFKRGYPGVLENCERFLAVPTALLQQFTFKFWCKRVSKLDNLALMSILIFLHNLPASTAHEFA